MPSRMKRRRRFVLSTLEQLEAEVDEHDDKPQCWPKYQRPPTNSWTKLPESKEANLPAFLNTSDFPALQRKQTPQDEVQCNARKRRKRNKNSGLKTRFGLTLPQAIPEWPIEPDSDEDLETTEIEPESEPREGPKLGPINGPELEPRDRPKPESEDGPEVEPRDGPEPV
ncbi:nucleolar protein 3-like [Amphiprion ocellaris]|uniref:nucleolar protein 3-like n=1 Tax=Amphiprion ocellaris TaxID=80972 RepID=UPI002410EDE6|nr:nucleolar protein 3-like [Amphiprion ocellaris]